MVIRQVVARPHRDGVVGACFLAHPAVDAAKQVDLVALGVALAWRDTVLGRVLGRLDHDAADRTRDRAQLAAHTFLQAVGVAVKDMLAPLRGGTAFCRSGYSMVTIGLVLCLKVVSNARTM